MGRCPHANIIHCPLYVAAHDPDGLGCVSSRDDGFACDVAEGSMDYSAALGRLMALDPRMVATLKWKEDNAARSTQRLQNMRALGIN